MRHTQTKRRRKYGRTIRRSKGGRIPNPLKSMTKARRGRMRSLRRSKRR